MRFGGLIFGRANLRGGAYYWNFSVFQFMYFSSQLQVLNFSECLNTMPGVLVAGNESRDEKEEYK